MVLSQTAKASVVRIAPDTGCEVASVNVGVSKPVPDRSINYVLVRVSKEHLLEESSASRGLSVSSLVQNTQIGVDRGRRDARAEDDNEELLIGPFVSRGFGLLANGLNNLGPLLES